HTLAAVGVEAEDTGAHFRKQGGTVIEDADEAVEYRHLSGRDGGFQDDGLRGDEAGFEGGRHYGLLGCRWKETGMLAFFAPAFNSAGGMMPRGLTWGRGAVRWFFPLG